MPDKLTLNYIQFLVPSYNCYLVPSCTPKNVPNRVKALPYSGALSDLKKLMESLVYDGKLYGEHSRKRGRASATAAHRATNKQLKRLGGRRSDAMPAK